MAPLELNDLRMALAALPEEQREALILIGAGGFSYEEAAEVCDCAVGTVKSRVSRARVALRRILETGDYERDPGSALQSMQSLLDEVARLTERRAA
jgi:RNA polymerase sigma-70 factor (ECF subfamily)